ncbi:transcription termination/antitermination protein NusG [Methylocella silvestris]|uniref:NusG-like N-terminal domain-containing protein n=1 Tax=Methylocella silvestris TaxID=199596 RepID=A0A2J7TJR8_METSI|nr:transcription termination/antitermination NusG family protein [Methylocella silvestris]PNG27018.1 hypothetical protein CR492_04760 [Methylocella silvestris]
MSATIWYVAYTNPKCEQRAAAALQRVGFETFLPEVARRVRCQGKYIERRGKLFPRYLFVGMRPICTWFDFRNADGVEAVLANEGKPLAISESLIDDLRAAVSEGAYNERAPALVEAGARVRIEGGPFAGFEGICEAVHGNKRADILVDLLNRPTIVKMRLDGLISLGPSSAIGQPVANVSLGHLPIQATGSRRAS